MLSAGMSGIKFNNILHFTWCFATFFLFSVLKSQRDFNRGGLFLDEIVWVSEVLKRTTVCGG